LASIYIKVTCKESLSTLIFSRSLLCFSILLIFYLVVYNFANTSLFSSYFTCNFTLSFCSFSKAPYKFWTYLSFSSMICLLLISRSESLNKMLVICVLYFVACWNILVVFLCSSSSTSNPCIDLGVWNLRVCPWN